MRFPSKKSFARASLLFIFAMPVVVHADPDADKKAEAARKSHYLTLDEAKAAFGSEFSTMKVGDTIKLYGGSSKDCIGQADPQNNAFSVEQFPNDGKFKIFYNGTNDACLKYADATKGVTKKEQYQGLDGLPEGQMKPSGHFDKVILAWDNPLSTKKAEDGLEIPTDDGKSISNRTAEEIANEKKIAEENKKQTQIDTDMLLVTKCHRGLKELDVGEEALARLKGIPDFLKDRGDKYFDEQDALFRKEKFAACRKQILKAKADDIAASECEDRLKKIADTDEKYVAKAKDLYLELVSRFMNASNLSVDEAYDAAIATIEKIRGFSLSEKEEEELAMKERNLQIHFLHLAAAQGVNSDTFMSMKEKTIAFMVEKDDVAGCIDEDTGAILPTQRQNAACASSQWLSLQLGQQVFLANSNQVMIDRQAAATKKQTDDALALQNCTTLRSSGTTLSAADDASCMALEAAASKIANGSLASVGDGFGAISTTPTTTTPASNTTVNTTSGSGLMNSVYTPTNQITTTAPLNVTPTVNSAQPGIRKLSHGNS